jgi:hypothetical protein
MIRTFWDLEEFGRSRLSRHFFMRDFLHSEIGSFYGVPNVPDDPELAFCAGRQLCETILEPLVSVFGPIQIRSGFRSARLNAFGAQRRLKCASNEKNYAAHIWDRRDQAGCMGATACIVIPWFLDHARRPEDWKMLAWWIHDHLRYHRLTVFTHQFAFNIGWHERPVREIYSFVQPRQWLTREPMLNSQGDHSPEYHDLLGLLRAEGRPTAPEWHVAASS